jgi:hypothetical protein
MELQQINSPFGFKQYLLRTFHFAKHYDELRASRFFRAPPTAVLRMKKADTVICVGLFHFLE